METIFEQDKHMLTFMEGVEKGESDFLLGLDDPTSVYKARFVSVSTMTYCIYQKNR